MHIIAVERPVRRCTQVILHVARTLDVIGLERPALKFVKDCAQRLAKHIAQNIQPSAMRHAEHNFGDPELTAALDDLFQRRNHRLGTVEAKPLRARVFDVAELLEELRLDELVENGALAGHRKRDALLFAFNPLLQPLLLRRVCDVHELEPDLAAIGAPQDRQHLPDGRKLHPQIAVKKHRTVQIGFREAISLRTQFLVYVALGDTERVEVRRQVPHHAVSADQHQRADRILRRPHRHGRRQLHPRLMRPLLKPRRK